MIEQQVAPGDFLYGFRFPSAVRGGPPSMSNEGIVDTSIFRQRTTRRRHGIFWSKVTSTTTVIQVDFRWLPWVDGKINYCEQQGRDVLSGWFSGCWMASYQEGSARVCHVALQDNDHDCKAAWRTQKATEAVRNVREFRPHTSTSKGSVKLGLVTSTNALYAIGLDATNLDIQNPWTDPAIWREKIPMLNQVQAEEFAAREVIPVTNVYPAGAWQVREISGPLKNQTFPAR